MEVVFHYFIIFVTFVLFFADEDRKAFFFCIPLPPHGYVGIVPFMSLPFYPLRAYPFFFRCSSFFSIGSIFHLARALCKSVSCTVMRIATS